MMACDPGAGLPKIVWKGALRVRFPARGNCDCGDNHNWAIGARTAPGGD